MSEKKSQIKNHDKEKQTTDKTTTGVLNNHPGSFNELEQALIETLYAYQMMESVYETGPLLKTLKSLKNAFDDIYGPIRRKQLNCPLPHEMTNEDD